MDLRVHPRWKTQWCEGIVKRRGTRLEGTSERLDQAHLLAEMIGPQQQYVGWWPLKVWIVVLTHLVRQLS
jgi:hypothetical protein